ncbi:MAG: nuclear transport factor 2 family protein [Planctomycetota bacterium]|jgi:ketosteroid isomerase-like protein
MIIWKGKGYLIIPVIFIGVLGVEYGVESVLEDASYYQVHRWPKILAGLVAGLLVHLFVKAFLKRGTRHLIDGETGEPVVLRTDHSLFCIPVRSWAWLTPALVTLVAILYAPPLWFEAREFGEELERSSYSTPRMFAEDLVSDGMNQRDTALSSDGLHFLYTLQERRTGKILHASKETGGWLEPQVASFSGRWSDLEPAFLPGSSTLYFASNRPLPEELEPGDYNLWRTSWEDGAWREPSPLIEVNTPDNEFYPSLTGDGALVFTSSREGGLGGEDLWMAQADGDGFRPAEPLGLGVNSGANEFNAAIHPNGNSIVFGSDRAGGPGGGDLYLSIRDEQGTWRPAVLLAGGINSPQLDYCPFFDPHEEVLWFTSQRPKERASYDLRLSALQEDWQDAGNGSGDLYRVLFEPTTVFFTAAGGEPGAVPAEPASHRPAEIYPPIPGIREAAEAYLATYLARDYPAMLPFMAEDAVFTDPTSTMFGEPLHFEGAQVIVDWLIEVGAGVESVEFLVDRSFISGEFAVFEGTYRTTGSGAGLGHPDLHTTLAHRGITMIRVVDGKVVLHHDLIDYEEMWRQLELGIRALESED